VPSAVVEGVFEAEAIGQSVREFIIELEGREIGRAAFDFSALE
jgi:hypothetical protein